MEKKKYVTEDGEHKSDVIVSWIITHGCQERCAYCISPEKCKEITDYETHKAIQDQMIATGLTKNRYIGGEPLLIPHLGKLIKESKKAGLNNRLSTNGILLTKEKLIELRDYLDSIALPFESCNDKLNQNIRGTKNHREIVTDRIKMIKELSDLGVLVNTCVHRENIHELEELAYLLDELGIDHWKLRKFNSSSGRGAVPNKNRFEISEEEFFDVVNHLQSLGLGYRIDGRLPSKLNTRLMVSPQGELYRMVEGEEEEVHYGKVLTKKLNIKEIYQRDGCN